MTTSVLRHTVPRISPESRLQRLALFTLFSFATLWVVIVVAELNNVLLWRFADAGTYCRVGRVYLDGADLHKPQQK